MTLGQLYKIWFKAFFIATIIAIIYVVVSTILSLRNPANDSDFAYLPYIYYAHGVVVFFTGLIAALWVGRKTTDTQLAALLFLIHALGASIVFPGSYFFEPIWIFVFLNPFAFGLFALTPRISWAIVKCDVKVLRIAAIVLIILALAVAYFLYLIVSAKPPSEL